MNPRSLLLFGKEKTTYLLIVDHYSEEEKNKMADFYQLPTSTTDFKSRSNDVFDKLVSLEKQHDVHTKTHTPISMPEEEASSLAQQNPIIPNNAITFKKRPADDEAFTRPAEKWKKYDLEDVNEHHVSSMGNRHALNDFFRTRVKPASAVEPQSAPSAPVFKRPRKKEAIIDDTDDDHQFIPIRAPVPSNPEETKTEDDDETTEYKLKSTRKISRGVMSTNEKKPIKSSLEFSKDKEEDDDDDKDGDVNDELFEP